MGQVELFTMTKTTTRHSVDTFQNTFGQQVMSLLKQTQLAQVNIQAASSRLGRVQYTLRRRKSS
ncbi:MAG: hypothetical protein CMJ28_02110 [Phycisphaerae bacterium]|nr:hypothetical protein [Phycisphaerae bacterium]